MLTADNQGDDGQQVRESENESESKSKSERGKKTK